MFASYISLMCTLFLLNTVSKTVLGEEVGKLSNCFKTVARDLYSFFTNKSQAG